MERKKVLAVVERLGRIADVQLAGAEVAVVGAVEYLLAGFGPPLMELFVTGVVVAVSGGLLLSAGWVA